MKISKQRPLLLIIITLAFSIFAAYSYLLRFTDFFLSSRLDKILQLGSIFLFFAIISLSLLTPAINRLVDGVSKKVLLITLLASTVITVVILLAAFRFPAFPKLMSLEIRPISESMDPPSSQKVIITSMTRYDPPRNIPTPINLTDLAYESGWYANGNSLEFSDSLKHATSVHYSSFVRGYIVVNLFTGPGQGEVEIIINGEGITLDLSSSAAGTIDYKLTIPNTWDNADQLRKIMLLAGFLSDSISIFLCCQIILILCYQVFVTKKLKVRGLVALAGLLLISVSMVFIASQMQKEVIFRDPVLEESVRSAINKPEGSLNSHQLLTIIELNLNGRNIQNIDGIEALRNLRILDLSNNQITDIQSLSKLKKLQELNLRENQVKDISPLAGLRNLTYLNLHSNIGITDISPIRNLTRLEKLILRNIQIGDQTDNFVKMTRLTYLNVRNCAITDLNFLANLMIKGALQDHQGFEVFSTVNILDNPMIENGHDPYEQVRPFWHKITYRYPFQLPYYPNGIAEPYFSHSEGFYEEGFQLTLSSPQKDVKIFYTFDGSEPVIDQNLEPTNATYEYLTPISINNRASEPNVLSNIETSKLSNYSPPSPVFKGTVIRAMVVDPENRRSRIITKSFFVDENMKERYTFPVVSIVTPPDGMFDRKVGIYVPGNLYRDDHPVYDAYNTANYTQKGFKWERPASFVLYSPDGEVLVEQEIGIRIQGNYTRAIQQKSLRLYAREEQSGERQIRYDFFPTLDNRWEGIDVSTFEELILRSGISQDLIIQSLLANTKLDIQGAMPVEVFIDGEYWGVFNVRTRYDEYYFNQYHGVNEDDLLVCQNEGYLYLGDPLNKELCTDIFRVIDKDYEINKFKTVDTLANPYMYKQICQLMDVNNFIDYYIAHIYADNLDRDYYYWRYTGVTVSSENELEHTKDGKWRWMIMDMDGGFKNPGRYTLLHVTDDGRMESYLLRSLLENPGFRQDFINRFADMLNTNFREKVVLSRINDFEDLYSPEIEEYIHRWGTDFGSLKGWQTSNETLREFARLRPNVQRDHITRYFGLPGIAQLTVKTESNQGYIKINTIDIREGTPGVDDPPNWTGIYFQGVPITVTAVPAEGYRFSHWEGLVTNTRTETSQQLTLSGDLELTAVFTR